MKRKVLIFVFVVIYILATGIFYGYIKTLDSWLHTILYFLVLAIIAFPAWYISFHKKRLTLTDDELQSPLIEHQDFSNSNTWSNYVFVLVILCLLPAWIFVSNITEMWLEGKSWEAIWAFQMRVTKAICTSPTWWLIVLMMVTIWLRGMIRTAKNKYIIDGDTLIIQENLIYKIEEEIRIPIACIDEVYTSSNWAPNPYLWIKVNGVPRRCYSFPHSLELGKAILRHKHALTQS